METKLEKRQRLVDTIKQSKKGKYASILVLVLSIASYVFFDGKQVAAEKELLILDHGKLDEMVLK